MSDNANCQFDIQGQDEELVGMGSVLLGSLNPVLDLYLLLGSLLYKIQKEQEMFVKIVSAFR